MRLIDWGMEEAAGLAKRLRQSGFDVRLDASEGPELLREIKRDPPAAVVIDLTRRPSHGREIALALRQSAAMRRIPLVFVGGLPEKIEAVRRLLPDATFTTWGRVSGAVRRAIANPPAAPIVPKSRLAGYSGRPLVAKLGIKPASIVAVASGPPDVRGLLGDLPEGAVLRDSASGRSDLTLWFTRSRQDLSRRIKKMSARATDGPVWIIWPKKGSARKSDFGEREVREAGLAAGLVDYKICAVDSTWSGLLFARRKKKT